MGQTAYVALETANNTYDIYYSDNGGHEYLLRPVLQQHFANKSPSTVDTFPKLYPDSVADHLPDGCKSDQLGEDPLVRGEALVESVQKNELVTALPWYDTEVLYLVSDQGVDVLVPLVLTARSLHTLFERARLELYHPDRDQTDVIQSMQQGGDPDEILKGAPISPEELHALPAWVRKTLEQGHRYLLHKCYQIQQDNSFSRMKLVLETGAVEVKVQSPGRISFLPALFIRVPWTENGPKYGTAQRKYGNQGPVPKIVTSKLRYNYYDEIYHVINEADDDESVVVNVPNAPLMAKSLYQRFGDEFAWEFLPDKFEGMIRNEL